MSKLLKFARSASFIAIGVFMALGFCPLSDAQEISVFTWTENKGDDTGTILVTPTATNIAAAATALANVTSYTSDFTITDDTLSIARQNLSPIGPNSAVAYYAGPAAIPDGGNKVIFSAWLNPSAQAGSSESIYDIIVNGVALSETVTADASNPSAQFEYTSPDPITEIQYDNVIDAVSGTSETGIGVSAFEVSSAPEPTTISLMSIALAGGLVARARRK
jgi:hypothetical protein